MTRRSNMGFDRRIDLEWLDAAAGKASTGASAEELRAYIWGLLDGAVSGSAHGSARQKTTTVLNHIWGSVPPPARDLRTRALSLFPESTLDERFALHWAMMMGTYPLFADLTSAVGRLLALQGCFTLAHLMRRLVESWGERPALERAGQRITRSMVQWGVLRDTRLHGEYEAAQPPRSIGAQVGLVMIEALLTDCDASAAPLSQLIGHSALFPFTFEVNINQLHDASQFLVHREGLDLDIVQLRKRGS